MVELSASAYGVRESRGKVCIGVTTNSTTSKPFSVSLIPVMKEPISATSEWSSTVTPTSAVVVSLELNNSFNWTVIVMVTYFVLDQKTQIMYYCIKAENPVEHVQLRLQL